MEDPAVQKILASRRREKIWAAPNFYLREDGKYFDTSLLVDDRGEVIGRQTMVHVAQAPCFYEQDYYTPSGDGFHVFETPFGRIGIVICFDRHYPESIRTEALMGSGYHPDSHRQHDCRARRRCSSGRSGCRPFRTAPLPRWQTGRGKEGGDDL